MSGIFQRLADMARAHVNDLVDKYWPDNSSTPSSFHDPESRQESETASFHHASSFETHASGGLLYSDELAACYRLLDLPFGTPLEQVTKQWRAYLKKSHPDLHAQDPLQQARATELTQEFNRAYSKIKEAWERYKS
jgi:hypothetical protein